MRNVPSKQQIAVSAKINNIRKAHGNPGAKCPTCCRQAADPYSRCDPFGRTLEGCVDAFHQGHLIGERARWHARPQAHALRKAELERISG